MPNSKSFWDHPIEALQEALDLRKQIDALQNRMTSLLRGTSEAVPTKPAGRRKMSPAARARMAAGQKARWARIKGSSAPKPSAKPTSGKSKKKGGLTPEGRARLAALMKARWAARKKGATAPNATAGASLKNPTTKKGNRTRTVYR